MLLFRKFCHDLKTSGNFHQHPAIILSLSQGLSTRQCLAGMPQLHPPFAEEYQTRLSVYLKRKLRVYLHQ